MEWLLTGQGQRTVDETIDGANAFMASMGGEPSSENQRDSLRRILRKRDVSVTLAALEKRAEVAEARLAAVKSALESLLKKI